MFYADGEGPVCLNSGRSEAGALEKGVVFIVLIPSLVDTWTVKSSDCRFHFCGTNILASAYVSALKFLARETLKDNVTSCVGLSLD